METTDAADPIRQQALPDRSAFRAEPLINRRFPDRDSMSGRCEVGRDAMVFCNSPVSVPAMEHSADTEQKRNCRHHYHQPSDREPHAKKTHGSSLDTAK